MTPAERSIRMRTNLVILTPGDRGYQDWADKRELLRLLDECRSTTHVGARVPGQGGGGADDPPPARPSEPSRS